MSTYFRKQPDHPTACLSVITTGGPAPEGYELATTETLAAARAWAEEQRASGAWVPAPPPVAIATVADIKAEAGRLILALAPSWKQSNMIARTVELVRDHGTDVTEWPSGAQAENAVYQAIWDQIKAIRAASDTLEASPPALANLTAAFAALLA